MSTSKPTATVRVSRKRGTPPPAVPTEADRPPRRRKPMRFAPGADSSAPESVSAAIQRALAICAHLSETDAYPEPEALADVHRLLEKSLNELEVLASSVMRVRDQTFGDRRVKLEYLVDPRRPGAVLISLVPASPTSPPDEAHDRIRTSEAATLLGVSRPHVAMLCDQGLLGPVTVTKGGQRRVSRDAVLAYLAQQTRERSSLDAIEDLTSALREGEHEELLKAAASAGNRWAKTQGSPAKPSKRDKGR